MALPEPFFLDASGGPRWCLYHAAAGAPRGAVVYVHPFAEEMNKSRRMAALGSRALADDGFAVLQIDLLGCGDSAGDFGDASWRAWLDDLALAADWLRARVQAPLWFWGLRAGALLAAEVARARGDVAGLLLWQPVLQGRTHWQQFMRLRLAAELGEGGGKAALEASRQALAAGQPVDIAGYRVAPALASGLEAAALAPPVGLRVVWLETSTRPEPALTPASATQAQAWRDAGVALDALAVAGPAFWQTTEIEEAPALLDATRAALRQPEMQPA